MNNIKAKKKIRKKLIILYSLIVLINIGLVVVFYKSTSPKKTSTESIVEEVVQDTESDENNNSTPDLKEIYKKNKEVNEDYVGQIYFDSELIDLPFVQGLTNNTYMRTDWQTMQYDVGGSIFLDASNDIENDQNTVIYGHNFAASIDSSITKMFSPLRALMKKDNYEQNKNINLFLGDKLLRYEVIYVYRVKVIEEDNIQYLADGEPYYDTLNFSKNEFNDYINKVKDREYYSTGKSIEYEDKMLTLQTCIDDTVDKLVVIAKQISNSSVN